MHIIEVIWSDNYGTEEILKDARTAKEICVDKQLVLPEQTSVIIIFMNINMKHLTYHVCII